MTATYPSTAPASRYVLQAIVGDKRADPEFTELCRLHCTARRWELTGDSYALTFLMQSPEHRDRMQRALKKHGARIQRLYADEGGVAVGSIAAEVAP